MLLGCIEMIALGEKLSRNGLKLGDYDARAWFEIGGSVFAVGGIVADTFYSATKSIREIQPYKSIRAIDQGADIWRGGLKLGAGALASLAGSCAVVLDVIKLKEEIIDKEKTDAVLAIIYGFRLLAGAGSTLLIPAIAFSYAKPLLENMAKGLAAQAARRRALLETGVKIVAWLPARVRLLVWVARFNLAGLLLTAAEIGYLYYKDDDLQNWCERCTFRKNKRLTNIFNAPTSNYYADANKELEALHKASQAVGIAGGEEE